MKKSIYKNNNNAIFLGTPRLRTKKIIMINVIESFSADYEQINTGNSSLIKYRNKFFNAKIVLLHLPCLTKPS